MDLMKGGIMIDQETDGYREDPAILITGSGFIAKKQPLIQAVAV